MKLLNYLSIGRISNQKSNQKTMKKFKIKFARNSFKGRRRRCHYFDSIIQNELNTHTENIGKNLLF